MTSANCWTAQDKFTFVQNTRTDRKIGTSSSIMCVCVWTSMVYRFYLNCLYFSTHEPKNKYDWKTKETDETSSVYMYTSFGFQLQWFDLILLHYGNTGDIATCLNNIMQHQPTKQTNKAINKYFGSIQFLVFVFFGFYAIFQLISFMKVYWTV